MVSPKNFHKRSAAAYLLAHGDATVAEIAKLAGVSRQAVQHWTKQELINVTKARRARLRELWKIAMKEAQHANF